jgi:CubicO group peptidase (beta-lactamase class C family)
VKKRCIPGLIAAAALAGSLRNRVTEAPKPDLLADQLQAAVAGGFSGSVLVVKRGQVLSSGGYGSIRGVKIRADSRFWIASISKQFTSVAILKGQEKGLLSLSDPICKFVPAVSLDKQAITLSHLLEHRSGLPNSYAATGIVDRSEAIAKILAQPLVAPPDSQFLYSDDNYALAAAILEVASGRSFEKFLTDELLRPAGLGNTGFWAMPAATTVVPVSGEIPAQLRGRNWGMIGSGGLFSTTRDLYRWYASVKQGKLLKPESIRQLFAPHVKVSVGWYALGWMISTTARGTHRLWSRGTEDFGANGIIDVFDDENVIVVVLSHAGDDPDGHPYTRSIRDKIERFLFGSV